MVCENGHTVKESDLIAVTRDRLNDRLNALYDPAVGHWHSTLSDSAVATAVAAFALARISPQTHASAIQRGVDWLLADQNEDGGWGDSPTSPSNLSATLLAWSALSMVPEAAATQRATDWIDRFLGGHSPTEIRRGICARYGGDRTFACPILTMCALAGVLGPADVAWEIVPQLPFELALMPHRLYRFLKLTVVSYAVPALISMGLARHTNRPTRVAPLRWLRNNLLGRALRVAARMQPDNGGYEEAAPLVGFVTMGLVAAGHRGHAIVRNAERFLVCGQRANGSWPIDTNLDTWVTVLATHALTHAGGPGIADTNRDRITRWLLDQQYDAMHPLTWGAPGGWGWSDLAGAMPDADDTCGVVLALRRLASSPGDIVCQAERGIRWIMHVQNSDGGIPTFSKGWGRLPFDRSCPDITAHALHAFTEWVQDVPPSLGVAMRRRMERMVRYLEKVQSEAGGWDALWFGTQRVHGERNWVYGTARAVISLRAIPAQAQRETVMKAIAYLLTAQNSDGGWGPHPGVSSSLEETAMATWAMASAGEQDAATRGGQWVGHHTSGGNVLPAAPIGLYFDRLWYAEAMYPLVFATGALNAMAEAESLS